MDECYSQNVKSVKGVKYVNTINKNIENATWITISCTLYLVMCVFMDKEMKTIFRNNVIKFIIGAILLSISYWYIQNHPAEKASIFSGFEVLFQRMEVYFYKITNKDSEWLKTKFDLEKTFDELISSAETKWCADANVLDWLHEALTNLKKERIVDLTNNVGNYKRQMSEFKTMIDASCK